MIRTFWTDNAVCLTIHSLIWGGGGGVVVLMLARGFVIKTCVSYGEINQL
jgi:hypothetical protein